MADLSSGFSGNFGYPLPDNWAYDQFVTRTLGTGDGRIEIDNNIFSGRDLGQSSFDPPRKPGGDDDSAALRSPSIDYNDREIYEVLRRYQGPGEPASTEARKRLGLYYVVEKYNLISRNL